jgi:hypothetical protein
MKFIAKLSGFLLLLAITIAGASYCMFEGKDRGTFLPNLLLNLVPEILGVAAGTMIAWAVATKFASDKFSLHADKYFNLIAGLRVKNKISGKVARKAMIVLVPLLNDKILPNDVGKDFVSPETKRCKVCGLRSHIHIEKGVKKCGECGLKAKHWEQGK